jgi:hypothetical protein
MSTRYGVDELMLRRERQFVFALLFGLLLAAQAVILYAAFTEPGARLVPALIGFYACGLLAGGAVTGRHRTPAFQLVLCGGLAALLGASAFLYGERTYVVGAIGFAGATLYYGWRRSTKCKPKPKR